MRGRGAIRLLTLFLCALLVAPPCASAAEPPRQWPGDVSVPGTSELELTVLARDQKALEGVEVILGTTGGEIVTRAVTGGDGRIELEGLQYGYYQVAFVHDGQSYVSNRVLLLAPDETTEATFALGDFTPRHLDIGLSPGQEAPLTGEAAVGVAELDETIGPTGWEWFRTGTGVTVLIGSAALVVGAVVALTDDEEQIISPSEPQ